MTDVYDHPEYYEIAFSFRDIPAEVDVFEECFGRFSRIPVRSVLELGCGNSPHMIELVSRDYQYAGLDLSEAVLEYSGHKASEARVQADFVCADMLEFSLDKTVDFVYVLLGSLYAKTTMELETHFRSPVSCSRVAYTSWIGAYRMSHRGCLQEVVPGSWSGTAFASAQRSHGRPSAGPNRRSWRRSYLTLTIEEPPNESSAAS